MWIKLASLLMFLTVAFGAFGAHALRNQLSEHQIDIWKTAVLYQFMHAIGLFVIAWLKTQSIDPKIQLAGWFFVAGIVLFSGSLYLLSITQTKWLGAITPLGGISFLIGWTLIILSKI